METTTLKHAVAGLARHFQGLYDDLIGRSLQDVTDMYFYVGKLKELAADIYMADLAVSHNDARIGAGLRPIAASIMAHACDVQNDIATVEAGGDSPLLPGWKP